MASFGGEAGDSMTSLLNDQTSHGHDVLTLDWASFERATDLSRVSLVKMDIEGAEFHVLPSLLPWLKRHRPALYLSTHGPFLDADTRAQRLETLSDQLSFYATCRDDQGGTSSRLQINDRSLNKFPTYLFTG